MSTIQNLKNFIRHGKQARLVTPHAEPTTDVTPVHAQQQRQPQGQYANNLDAIQHGNGNGQAPSHQKATDTSNNKISRADIEKLVAEERHSKSKMPKYPGLDRYILVEKMGDGAFSNVYRAKDTLSRMEEVAIKVVRKFEMNSNQVWIRKYLPSSFPSLSTMLRVHDVLPLLSFLNLFYRYSLSSHASTAVMSIANVCRRAFRMINTLSRIRRNTKPWRCEMILLLHIRIISSSSPLSILKPHFVLSNSAWFASLLMTSC
jgi:hypothetical protein